MIPSRHILISYLCKHIYADCQSVFWWLLLLSDRERQWYNTVVHTT